MTSKRNSKRRRARPAGRGLMFYLERLGRLGLLSMVAVVAGIYGVSACFGLPSGSGAAERQETIGFRGQIVHLVNPGETAGKIDAVAELLGVDPGHPWTVLVAGTEARAQILEEGPGGEHRVRVQLELPDLQTGTYEVAVRQGDQIYRRESAFHVIPRPSFRGVACGTGAPWELEGDLLELEGPGLPKGAGWLVKSGDATLAIQNVTSSSHYQVDLSPVSGRELDLTVRVHYPDGSVDACQQSVQRGGSKPRIDVAWLVYDPQFETLHLHLEGASLPAKLRADISPENGNLQGVDFMSTGTGSAQARDYVVKNFEVDHGESEVVVRHDGETLQSSVGIWVVESPERWVFRSFKSRLDIQLAEVAEEVVPRVETEIVGATYHWVKVPVRNYLLGLTPEQRLDPQLARQNLANPSSGPNGTVALRLGQPFLIGVHEVTNAQFHTYLRAASVPDDQVPETLREYRSSDLPSNLAELPVTQVSYIAARGFVAWLQGKIAAETDRWRVRIPHEVEWEMAARGGDTADYAFRDQNLEEGLKSLDREGARPVGTNRWDRSLLGARDMTGNVREWTQTPYQEQLLDMLAFHLDSQWLEVWDPAQPYVPLFEAIPDEQLGRESRNITVRGAANGESSPVLSLLAVRQQRELSNPYEGIGFRLVLVPTRGL